MGKLQGWGDRRALGAGITGLGLALAAAWPVSTALAKTGEEVTMEIFNEALVDRDAGLLYSAIEDLEMILELSPKAQRVKVELAVAYYRALFFDEAERLAREVLEEEDVEDEVRTNVESFLELIDKRRQQAAARRNQVSYDVALGLGYDDNVNQSPEDFLGSTANINQEEDGQFTATGRVTHKHVFPGSVRVGDRAGVVSVKSAASYYRKEYFDETQFNVDVLTVSTAPRVTIAKKMRIELPLQLDYIRLSDDPLAWFGSLNPSVTLLTDFGEVKVKGILQQREYVNSSSESREGARTGVEVSWANQMFDKRLLAEVGLESVFQHAEAERQEYDSLKFKAQGKWKFNEQWAARSRYSYLRRDYRGTDPFVGTDGRETRQHSLQLGAEYTVLDWGMLNDWVFGATVSYTDVSANDSVYEYDRLQYNLTANRKFK